LGLIAAPVAAAHVVIHLRRYTTLTTLAFLLDPLSKNEFLSFLSSVNLLISI
jgi:hypothetical protein